VLDVPVGLYADNAALAFNATQSARLYGQQARRRRRQALGHGKGNELRSWKLPPGLANYLAFHSSGKLLHFQVETEDGKQLPVMGVSWKAHPRVCRIRDLLGKNASRTDRSPQGFRVGVLGAAVAPTEVTLRLWGLIHDSRKPILKVIAGTSGAVLYSREGEQPSLTCTPTH